MSTFYSDLSADRANLSVAGEDARAFLDNLLTADTGAPVKAAFAALLTPQGKILFDMLIFTGKDRYLLNVAKEQAPALMKRLTLYRLRAKVTISEFEGSRTFVMWGGGNPEHGFTDPRLPELGCWHIADAADPEPEGEKRPPQDWHGHRIRLGVPLGGTDFEFGSAFPHDVNMDDLNGVDFEKGCYVGQEVVSRMKHRGTARKRTMIVRSSQDLSAGDVLAGDRTIGTAGAASGTTALAVLRLDRASKALADGVPLTLGGSGVTLERPGYARFSWPLTDEPAGA